MVPRPLIFAACVGSPINRAGRPCPGCVSELELASGMELPSRSTEIVSLLRQLVWTKAASRFQWDSRLTGRWKEIVRERMSVGITRERPGVRSTIELQWIAVNPGAFRRHRFC